MANTLSVSEWKTFVKKNSEAKEAEKLTDVLEDYGKLKPKDTPDARLSALKEVQKTAAALKKKNTHKGVLAFLNDVTKEADAEEKALLREKKELEEAESEEGEDDGDGDGDDGLSPEVRKARKALKTRIQLTRKAPREEAKGFFLALAPKVSGLMIAKAALSADHRKQAILLREGKGRVLTGVCFGDSGKLVFAFEMKVSGGLAKALKRSVLALTGLDVRVRVEGPGGEGFEDDDESPELTEFGSEGDGPNLPENQAGGTTPVTPTTQPTTDGTTATTTDKPRADGSAVSLAHIKIQWNQAKQMVKSQLDQLATDVLADVDEPEEEGGDDEPVGDMAGAVRKLDKVLTRLNLGLAETLDEHYTAEPSARPEVLTRLTRITGEYLKYLESDELIALVEENPYRKVLIRGLLTLPLTKLRDQIAAAAAR